MTLNEIKNLTKDEANKKILEIKKQIFELEFKKTTKQNIKTHLLKKHKKTLAQILTIHNNYN